METMTKSHLKAQLTFFTVKRNDKAKDEPLCDFGIFRVAACQPLKRLDHLMRRITQPKNLSFGTWSSSEEEDHLLNRPSSVQMFNTIILYIFSCCN